MKPVEVARRCFDVNCASVAKDPERWKLNGTAARVAWKEVPTACGFKVNRPFCKAQGAQRAATEKERKQQVDRYRCYVEWAQSLGLDRSVLDTHVESVAGQDFNCCEL